jgi:TonB family protein
VTEEKYYGIFFGNIMYIISLKKKIMNNKKLKTRIQALVASGLVLFFIACNNSDYTKSPAKDSGNTSANADTAMNNSPVADTNATKGSSETPKSKQGTAMKKKGKITLGSMATKETNMKPDKEGVYNVADVMPAYPGGQNALEDYMNNNVEYPQNAIDNNSEGTVKVQFIVDENGNVTNAKVVEKKLGNGLDEEAVKVVSNMPKWTPGKVKGKNVKTRIVLPVTYKLEE